MSRIEKLSRSQRVAANLAKKQLDTFWAAHRHLPPVDFEALLLEVLPALADRFGNVAAAAAADWYEETRAEMIGGRFTSPVARANLEAASGSARWLSHSSGDPRSDAARRKAQGALDRHVKNAGRDTITAAMRIDPSRPRWARVMRGRETCGWCRMLASRGFVYESQATAGGPVEAHGWGHDKCDCEPIPEWTLTPQERDAYDREVRDLFAQYEDVRSRCAPGPLGYITDEQIAEEWRRSMIDYDAVREQLAKARTGMTLDKSLHQDVWDRHRRNLLELLEHDYPDGYVGTRRLIPRHPAQAPTNWPDDLPKLRAREWNHLLYGDNESGGHLPGFGWVHDSDEFPANWTRDDIAEAMEVVLRTAKPKVNRTTLVYEMPVRGINLRVIVNNPKPGRPRRILSAYGPGRG